MGKHEQTIDVKYKNATSKQIVHVHGRQVVNLSDSGVAMWGLPV
jgi:hypothetical protein